MTLSLVTSPAAANANSYATIAEADAYHEGHLYSSLWTVAASGEKIAALVMATRLLDGISGGWTGVASTAEQALCWPRQGMLSLNGFAIASGEIPARLKCAEAEYARQLLGSDLTETNTILAQGISRLKAGSVELAFKEPMSQYDAAIPSNRALAAMVPDAVKALLVPSWLVDPRVQDGELSGFVCEAI